MHIWFDFWSIGDSIKCWVCRSDGDPKCADPFDNKSFPITDCKIEKDRKHLGNLKATMCRKVRQKGKLSYQIRFNNYIIDEVKRYYILGTIWVSSNIFQWREIGDIYDLALGLVSLGWALLVDILQMKDTAFIGLEHTIFTWNIAHAGNMFLNIWINTGCGK